MAAGVDCRGFDLLGSILSVVASHLAHHWQDATIHDVSGGISHSLGIQQATKGKGPTMPRLRRSDWRAPGITRRRRGRGFSYLWANGESVSDPEILDRIARLAIPPAWTDVWICPWPHGHIQAVGTDKVGRRQYRYHDAWRVLRDRQKFERVLEFGGSLPGLRTVVESDLSLEGVSEPRVLAAAVRLLDLGFFRIGGEQYAQENETFGIATLQKCHVRLSEGEMVFDYPAKGSIRRIVSISDPETFRLIQVLKRRRGGGDNLLAHKKGARWVDVRSDEVNAYIRNAIDGEYSAKDFRTWSATMLGAVELGKAARKGPMSNSARRRASRLAVKAVSEYLGNTPAVCRTSYIDPKVLDRFEGDETIAPTLRHLGPFPDMRDRAVRETIESAVIDLVTDEGSDSAAEIA
jgi:DNA topoisomerase-1